MKTQIKNKAVKRQVKHGNEKAKMVKKKKKPVLDFKLFLMENLASEIYRKVNLGAVEH
jgi:hypothetical protein